MFYSHDRSDEQVTSSVDPDITGDDFQTNTFGVGYRHKGLSLRAEHSRADSSRDSTESTQLSANYIWPLAPGTSLSAGVSQGWLESSGDGSFRERSVFKAKGRIRSRLGKNLRLSGKVEWRSEDSSDIGSIEGLTLGSSLEYDYRAFKFRAGWDSYALERDESERSNSMFYFRIIRRF